MDREALVQAILDLENGRPSRIADPLLSCQLAQHVKPYIDHLTSLQGLPGEEEDQVTIGPLATEAGIFPETEDKKPRGPQPVRGKTSHQGSLPEIASLSPQERARWIFLERFITLEQHQDALGYEFAPADSQCYLQDLATLLDNLLMLPDTVVPAEQDDLPTLQKIFASTLLIFRNSFIGDEAGDPIPCTIENLRRRYPDYFYKRHTMPNWYEDYSLYTDPLEKARWVLCGIDYLNCTLRSPERKLEGYAKRWHIPVEQVVQKNALEDIYDRILCGETLGEHLFEHNCSSCTSTSYRTRGKGPTRTVYTVQRNQKIAIHGKSGIPHWRASKRLWPGVFPTIIFP